MDIDLKSKDFNINDAAQIVAESFSVGNTFISEFKNKANSDSLKKLIEDFFNIPSL